MERKYEHIKIYIKYIRKGATSIVATTKASCEAIAFYFWKGFKLSYALLFVA